MADILPNFVDMSISPQERKDDVIPDVASTPALPVYPYGLCISLTQEELEKLDMEDDANVGDHVILHCLAKVTSVSKNDTTDGTKTRVEMQIVAIEAEDDDGDDEEESPRRTSAKEMIKKAYGGE